MAQFKTPQRTTSQESIASGTSEASSGYSDSSSNDLSVVALFDDLMRHMEQNRKDGAKAEEAFLNFALETQKLFDKYTEVVQDCQKLNSLLEMKVEENREIERRLTMARKFLDKEKKRANKISREKAELEDHLEQVRKLLFRNNHIKIEDAKERLSFLNQKERQDDNDYGGKKLTAIQEINSTGSMLSDFSVSRSEGDFDVSRNIMHKKEWKKHRASTGEHAEPDVKRRRSSVEHLEIGPADTVRATTTVTVNNKGPITATSVIECIPNTENDLKSEGVPSSDDGTVPSAPPEDLVFGCGGQTEDQKTLHSLQQKTIVMPETCICCEKKIRFGKSALKCKRCRSVCHYECQDQLPLPCTTIENTPNYKNIMGLLSDYTPHTSPMVPDLIVHCLKEIEHRGLEELGLYRISASEKDVKSLKEKFLRGRGIPHLSQLDIHVLCSCVKLFLRSLNESIITYALWRDFVQAVEARDPQDVVPALYQCISKLPQPNRDTLAYIMLHFQRVANSPECKMPIENLAKVFGPTIVGFSCENLNPNNLLTETRQLIKVMEQLIRLPSDYWNSFVNVANQKTIRGPQRDSSMDLMPHRIPCTPSGNRSVKRKNIFATPPAYKK